MRLLLSWAGMLLLAIATISGCGTSMDYSAPASVQPSTAGVSSAPSPARESAFQDGVVTKQTGVSRLG